MDETTGVATVDGTSNNDVTTTLSPNNDVVGTSNNDVVGTSNNDVAIVLNDIQRIAEVKVQVSLEDENIRRMLTTPQMTLAETKKAEEKANEKMVNNIKYMTRAIATFVGEGQVKTADVVRVIAHGMSVASKMQIDNKSKKVCVMAGIKNFVSMTNWDAEDKDLVSDSIDLLVPQMIDTIADVHVKKIDLTQAQQKSCCVIL